MFDSIFYQRLPEMYRILDRQALIPYQLRQYLKILGGGFDELYNYTIDLSNLYDIDNVDATFLPALIRQLGFKFPYDMTEIEKRNIVKILPTLYKFKGSGDVFEYLGRQVLGKDTVVLVSRGINVTTLLADKDYRTLTNFNIIGNLNNNIILNADFTNVPDSFNDRINKYKIFAEEFRPVNTVFSFQLNVFWEEIFEKVLSSSTTEIQAISDENVETPTIEYITLAEASGVYDELYNKYVGFLNSTKVINNNFILNGTFSESNFDIFFTKYPLDTYIPVVDDDGTTIAVNEIDLECYAFIRSLNNMDCTLSNNFDLNVYRATIFADTLMDDVIDIKEEEFGGIQEVFTETVNSIVSSSYMTTIGDEDIVIITEEDLYIKFTAVLESLNYKTIKLNSTFVLNGYAPEEFLDIIN